MPDPNLPAYPGAGGKNRATQLRNQQERQWRAADVLQEQTQRAMTSMTNALAESDREASAQDRLRALAQKGRFAQ